MERTRRRTESPTRCVIDCCWSFDTFLVLATLAHGGRIGGLKRCAKKMIATIITTKDQIWFGWLICSIVFVIPFLTGILMRVLLSEKIVTYAIAVLLALTLSGLKLHILEFPFPNGLQDLDPETVFAVIWAGIFAFLGVRTTSAYYYRTLGRQGRRAAQSGRNGD